jgi:hypothetical protein
LPIQRRPPNVTVSRRIAEAAGYQVLQKTEPRVMSSMRKADTEPGNMNFKLEQNRR